MLNPKLKEGDRIIILDMEDNTPVPVLTRGTITGIFTDNGEVAMYEVDWDNGSRLSIIPTLDKWCFEKDFDDRKKKKINEITSTSSGGKYRSPLVLSPQLWDEEQMGAFTIPVSKYLSADLSYDSYDGKMERSKKQIGKEEKFAKKIAKIGKETFSQNDDDGNPFNGYNPQGSQEPGTPDYIKKIANLPKSQNKPVIKNSSKEKKLMSKSRMVEGHNDVDEVERFKRLIKNADVFKNFDMKFLHNYLIAVRDSGITNMFSAAPYLYMGSERIKHEFKYNPVPDEESYEKVLEMADQAQSIMINGVIKILEKEKIDFNVGEINYYLQKFASKVLDNYMNLF